MGTGPTVEGTFRLIDKASSVLDAIWRKAKLVDKALESLGKKLDKLQPKLDATAASAEVLAKALDNVAGRYEVTVDVRGATTGLAQVQALDRAVDDLDRKVTRRVGKAGLISKALGMVPTFGSGRIEAQLGFLDRWATSFTRKTKPLAMGLGGVVGGLKGMLTAFPLLITLGIALLPVIIGLAGGIAALAASLGAAVVGGGLAAGGLLGAFTIGIAAIAAVMIPAVKQVKEMNKAIDALNKAQASGNPAAILRTQKAVNQLSKDHPGVEKLALAMKGIGAEWAKVSKPAQTKFFSLAAGAIATIKSDLPAFGRASKIAFGGLAAGVKPLERLARSKDFRSWMSDMARLFAGIVRNVGPGLASFAKAMMGISRTASPFLVSLSRSFRGMMDRFDKWANSKRGQAQMKEYLSSFREWLRLLKDITKLLFDLFLPGARHGGDNLVTSLDKTVNNWDKKVKKGGADNFFSRGARDLKTAASDFMALVGALSAIAHVLPNLLHGLAPVIKFAGDHPNLVLAALGTYVGVKGAAGAFKGAKGAGGFFGKLTGAQSVTGIRGTGVGSAANPLVVVGKGSPGLPDDKPKTSTFGKIKGALAKYGPSAGVGARVAAGAALSPEAAVVATTAATIALAHLVAPGRHTPTVAQITAAGNGLPYPKAGTSTGGLPTNPRASERTNPFIMLGGRNPAVANAIKNYHDSQKGVRDDASKTKTVVSNQMGAAADSIVSNLTRANTSVNRILPSMLTEMQQALSKIGGGSSVTQSATNAGFTPLTSTPTNNGRKAMGGRLGGRGLRDTIPLGGGNMGAPGELVVNRHQERRINAKLASQGTSVESEIRGFPRPHYYAGGGRLGGNFSPTGGLVAGGLKPGVSKAAQQVLGHFPGLSITSTTGGTHAPGSYHYLGEAVDIAGAPAIMNAAAAWVGRVMGGNLTEGIHNPNLSVKFGKRVAPSFWGASTWAGHANHIHLAVAGALGALAGMGGTGGHHMRRRNVAGKGLPQAIGQRGVNRARSAAQKRINAAAASMGAFDGTGGLTSAGGKYGRSKLMALWKQAGGDPGLARTAAAIALAESGGDPNIDNPSGAAGLWQILGQVVPGNIHNPHVNALNAVSKERSAHGWSPWVTYTSGAYRKYLSQGGRMEGQGRPDWGGWFEKGGSFTAHRPTYIGVGEGHGSEKVTVQPTSTVAGRGGGMHIKKVVVYGNENTKRAVMEAFRDLNRELQLHHGVDDEDGDE